MSDIQIELRPHVGRDMFGNEHEHNQWMIYANGMHCGYVGHDNGAPINLFNVNKSMELKVRRAVCEKLEEVRPVAVPPTDAEVARHMESKRAKR